MGRRIGKFVVSQQFVEDIPEVVKQLLSGMIVVRCEYKWHDVCFHYTAIGDVFDEKPDGAEVPKYDIVVDGPTDAPKFTFTKKV